MGCLKIFLVEGKRLMASDRLTVFLAFFLSSFLEWFIELNFAAKKYRS